MKFDRTKLRTNIDNTLEDILDKYYAQYGCLNAVIAPDQELKLNQLIDDMSYLLEALVIQNLPPQKHLQFVLTCDCASTSFVYNTDKFICNECGMIYTENKAGMNLLGEIIEEDGANE